MIFCNAIIFLILCVTHILGSNNIVIRTNYGAVSGEQIHTVGRNVYKFLGIPYAKPPVGKLRFKYPQKPDSWKGILDATKPAPACMQAVLKHLEAVCAVWQTGEQMSEDCLYLNIWTRSDHNQSTRTSTDSIFGPKDGRPVMVWIHGGDLTRGSASLEVYNGAYLASMMDVVVVSVQYRLGPLGFLYLGTDEVSGNQGLMDQAAALEWIRDNIAYFGGNPQQITLFGHAGSVVCVALHMLSPVSRHLFQQAILQSGSPLAWWAMESKSIAIEKAYALAKSSGCKQNEEGMQRVNEELIECLRSVPASELVRNQYIVPKFLPVSFFNRAETLNKFYGDKILFQEAQFANLYYDITFKPVVSAPFLSKWPYEILQMGQLKTRHRIMMGVNKDEGMFHIMYMPWSEIPGFIEKTLLRLDPIQILALHFMNEKYLSPLLIQATAFEYQLPTKLHDDVKPKLEEVVKTLNEIGGDYNIKCPLIDFADYYSHNPNSQVFFYSFEHRTEEIPSPSWTGVMQGFEAEYIFGAPFNLDFQRKFYNFTDAERNLSREMMRFWTNFASTGSPNLNPGEFHTRNKKLYWERYQSNVRLNELPSTQSGANLTDASQLDTSRKHMVFTLPQSYMSNNLRRHQCMFWRQKLPLLKSRLAENPMCATNTAAKVTDINQRKSERRVGTLYRGTPKPKKSAASRTSYGEFFVPFSRIKGSILSLISLVIFKCLFLHVF